MLTALLVVTLLLYAFVVSQPFFYWMGLGRAACALSGPAYVELRQRINVTMNARLPRLYLATLASVLAVVGVALRRGDTFTAVATAVAGGALVADLVLAVRRSVPINAVMDAWTRETIPSDWADHRARWVAAFTTRQYLLCAGFVSLVLGAVAGR